MNREIETLDKVAPAVAVSTWTLDASHSSANFAVKHMMVSNVRGEFQNISGTLQYDASNLENSSVQITIKADSINTRDEKRDGHLKSADFFDVEKYPEITFRSSKFEKTGAEELKVTGDLTMHGVTKEVVLDVEGPTKEHKDPWGGTRIGFEGKTKLNRKDFGLTWNVALETGGVLVSEDIKITLETEFVKA